MEPIMDEDFINNLSDDPVKGILEITQRIINIPNAEYQSYMSNFTLYKDLLEAYGLLLSLNGVVNIPNLPKVDIDESHIDNMKKIKAFAINLNKSVERKVSLSIVSELKSKYDIKYGNVFRYDFTEGDLKKIQKLIDEARNIITESDQIEDEFKRRLLKKLEKLQSELHKKVSDLDRFYGFIGDMGVLFGKFGNDIKPLIDRFSEIIKIVWRTQAITEQLESDSPAFFLPFSTDNKLDGD